MVLIAEGLRLVLCNSRRNLIYSALTLLFDFVLTQERKIRFWKNIFIFVFVKEKF